MRSTAKLMRPTICNGSIYRSFSREQKKKREQRKNKVKRGIILICPMESRTNEKDENSAITTDKSVDFLIPYVIRIGLTNIRGDEREKKVSRFASLRLMC